MPIAQHYKIAGDFLSGFFSIPVVTFLIKNKKNPPTTLTLFYTRGLEIVVSHVMVPLPYRFSLGFFT